MVTVMCSAILLNINHRGAFPVTQSAFPHPLVPALALQCTAHVFLEAHYRSQHVCLRSEVFGKQHVSCDCQDAQGRHVSLI